MRHTRTGLEAEVHADHRFGRMCEVIGGGIQCGQIGRFIQIAAILHAETDVREESPVEAGTIDVYGFGLRLCIGSVAGHVEQHARAEDAEGATIGDVKRGHPVRSELVSIRGDGNGRQSSRRDAGDGAANPRAVIGLVGAVVGVGHFETEDGVGDVPQFDQGTGPIGWALCGAVAGRGSAECAVDAPGDVGLRVRGGAAERDDACDETRRRDRFHSHDGLPKAHSAEVLAAIEAKKK